MAPPKRRHKGSRRSLEQALLDSVSGSNDSVERVCIGLHWTAVKSKNVGMAHTYKTARKVEVEGSGELEGTDAWTLAQRILSWEPLEASLGTAALNSLLDPAGDKGTVNDIIMEKAKGATVTIVGRFPFNDDLRKLAKKVHVLEMEPDKGELPPHAAERVIPESDLAVISATALINHSLQRLLELASGSYTVVLGPSTPMSRVLFDFGADVLGGVRVAEEEALFKSLSQGAKSFNSLRGIEPVCLYSD
jgi:hypothetical protein